VRAWDSLLCSLVTFCGSKRKTEKRRDYIGIWAVKKKRGKERKEGGEGGGSTVPQLTYQLLDSGDQMLR